MINSLFLSHNCLLTLNSAATLSVYRLEQAFAQSSNSLSKLESSLGISLRKPDMVFDIPLGNRAKFIPRPVVHNQEQFVLIYDHQSVIAFNGSDLYSNMPQLNVAFCLNVSSLSHSTQEKSPQISTVSIYCQNQHYHPQILITTTSGSIHLMKISSQMNLEQIKSTSLQLLEKNKNSQIVTESEQHSLGLFNSTNQGQLNSEYVCAVESDAKVVYVATSKQRLLAINKDTFQIVGEFETSREVDATKSGTKSFALKVMLVRNSVMVLFPKKLLQFNIYTYTQSSSMTLPMQTLDFSVLQCPKTLNSSLVMVGECNKVYSIGYEETSRKSGQMASESVEISSRMGKCVAVRDRLVLVGGSDGTVDVLLNGEMMLAVLVQDV